MWGHWLGTGNTWKGTVQFLPFGEALGVARSLGLANTFEWRQVLVQRRDMCPPNVPSAPNATYKDGGWQGWGHWLGTGNQSSKAKREEFLPFDQALRSARHLRLVSSTECKLWCRSGARPANVPANPDQAYVHDGRRGRVHFCTTPILTQTRQRHDQAASTRRPARRRVRARAGARGSGAEPPGTTIKGCGRRMFCANVVAGPALVNLARPASCAREEAAERRGK